jgi:hypothetical protein
MDARAALLMSGGIGDFLHYIVRFSSFLERRALTPEGLTVFVESTQPHQVESLFRACLPEVGCHFVPPALHWTKTNPLLNVDRAADRLNRPAYQYVLRAGARHIEDWFLPLLCDDYPADKARINFLLGGSAGASVFVSARDKGFLWWPSAEAFALVERHTPRGYELICSGTGDERPPWLNKFVTAPNVLAALKLSCAASLFVGTDTGLATARELLGLPNIYCINWYWYEELMVKYRYWTERMAQTSRSRFAFSLPELQAALASFFA